MTELQEQILLLVSVRPRLGMSIVDTMITMLELNLIKLSKEEINANKQYVLGVGYSRSVVYETVRTLERKNKLTYHDSDRTYRLTKPEN